MTLGLWQMLAWLFVAAGWWTACAHLADRIIGRRGYAALAAMSALLTVPVYALAWAWPNGYVLYWFWTGVMLTLLYVGALLVTHLGEAGRAVRGRR